MANPYHYGSPVAGDQFAGRHGELRSLLDRMRDGINVVLISPRRYGKTSLLNKAVERLEADGAAVVAVSAMGVADVSAFAAQLLARTYAVRNGKWHRVRQAVPEFLRRVRVTPSVTFEGDNPTFTLTPSLSATDLDSMIGDVYELLAELSDKQPAVLIIDEFQDVRGLGAHLPALFKALADRHPNVSLVLAGSKRHVMEQLVLGSDAPLYGMATRLALAALPPAEMSDFLVRRAAAGDKDLPTELADRIVEIAGPVPNDIQYLAYEVYGLAGHKITAADVENGMRLAVEHEADFCAFRFDSLGAGQRRLMTRLAHTPTAQPYADEFRQAVRLRSPGALRNALKALQEQDLVVVQDEQYRVASPFFGAWLRSRP